ncbi:PAS domain-containing protein [Methylophaga sp. OBS4]|uniref:PAS domain-containing protein n=1 Tax=Methylophaga sp. OBS4 TaxID=2991935 RepID=UPI00225249AB|nr:PAS domain-containing protein [Methylophaga sp. OBS4]MCX4187047.1 PAS domain-containing protein [Methylophaga sp. OBS4]
MHWKLNLVSDEFYITEELLSALGWEFEPVNLDFKQFMNLIAVKDRDRVQHALQNVATGNKPAIIEYTVILPDHEKRVIRQTISPLVNQIGLVTALTGTLVDISELWKTRKQTENLSNFFNEAKLITHIGSWETDLAENRLYWSDETCRMLGVLPSQFSEKLDEFYQLVLPDDRNKIFKQYQNGTADNELFELEYRIRRADNQEIRWLYERGRNISGNGHSAQHRLGIVMDVTARKKMEALVQLENIVFQELLSQSPLDDVINAIANGIKEVIYDVATSIHLIDRAHDKVEAFYAPSIPAELSDLIKSISISDLLGHTNPGPPNAPTVIIRDMPTDPVWADLYQGRHDWPYRQSHSFPIMTAQQELIAVLTIYYPNSSSPSPEEENIIRRICHLYTITIEKHHNHQALMSSEGRFRHIFNDSATGIAITDLDGKHLEFNHAYRQLLGYTESELKQKDIKSLTHPADWKKNQSLLKTVIAGERDSFIIEKRFIGNHKKIVWVRMSVTAQKNSQGKPIRLIGICENISERIRAEKKHAEAQEVIAHLFTNLPGIAYRGIADKHWTMLFLSQAVKEVTGYDAQDLIHNSVISFAELIHQDDQSRIKSEINQAVKENRSFQVEYRIIHADGSIRWVCEQGKALSHKSGDGHILLDGYMTDITAQKAAEQTIEENEERFELLLKASSDAIWDWNLTTNTVWRSNGFESLFGYKANELQPSLSQWKELMHPEDRKKISDDIEAFIASTETKWSVSYRYLRKDGGYAHVLDRAYLIRDAGNNAVRMVGGMTDVTERMVLEEKLLQSQRLESIGQLTGGVAHDFNNILTVMLGNAEMIIEETTSGDQVNEMAQMIVEAARRGAELTQSLLSFARKQSLKPQKVDINTLIRNMKPLLLRTIGEPIHFEHDLNPELSFAKVDPGQLENALLNLLLNARDAMKNGGVLKISTQNTTLGKDFAVNRDVVYGKYIMLSVCDNGAGISADNLRWVFEPFFTTKPKGKGTGLGLAMVYGFVKQSGGHIEINSTPGQGTRVDIYLPSFKGNHHKNKKLVDDAIAMQGRETILLVEDDDLVRRYARQQLTKLGYIVVETDNAKDALKLLETHHPDLLFTDIILPGGMNGIELAEEAKKTADDLKVLFTSGYTDNAVVEKYRKKSGFQLLAKPYKRQKLAAAVRQVLD